MSGIEKIPLRVPEQWDAAWFSGFIRDVLAKLDTRNAIGDGILISSDGNSVATLSATDAIEQAIESHDQAVDSHEPAFDAHRAEADPHPDLIDDLPAVTAVAEADLVLVSQSGVNRRATIDQLTDAIFGDDWDDLVITGTAVNPPGAAADPSLNSTTGLLEFSAAADNVCTFVWQIPHGWSGAWDATMAIMVPHIHVRSLTSTTAPNNVSRWKFEYDAASVNSDFANAYGSFTTHGTVSVTNPANTARHHIIGFGNLDLAGKGISTMLHGRVTRLANSDGADTDTSVIALYSADLHIRRRRWGTESEYTTP